MAFAKTELDTMLRAKGVTADACVGSTVREASDRGYEVLVVEDGVESMAEELKRWSLESIKVGGLFGVTADSQAVLYGVASWHQGSSEEQTQAAKDSVRLAIL